MAQKVLFIDRDGTLVLEPPVNYQLDSFKKLEFYPKVFTYLNKIAKELDFKLVMVTNQDGLGTDSFPEETFWPVHDFVIKSFENEGVVFDEVLIDRTFPHENAKTRKPEIGLVKHFLSEDYDLENSFVIGDRLTDMELAKNLGSKGIFINDKTHLGTDEITVEETDLSDYISLETNDWERIYEFLKLSFNHMLDQIARHGQMDLQLRVDGDLEVDEHHTIEDTAIALGEVFHEALGNKLGIERYGFCLPMDDCLAQVTIDFGGRNWLVWDADFKREMVGDMPTEMFYHFFKSFTDGAKANLNIKAEGKNEHHKIEAIFKAFAKAIKMAVKRDVEKMVLPSTKGML